MTQKFKLEEFSESLQTKILTNCSSLFKRILKKVRLKTINSY